MADEHHILGVRVDDLTDTELESKLRSFLLGGEPKLVVTPNPEFILAALDDPSFREVLSRADLSLPDGVGLTFAVAALSEGVLNYRHTGVETLPLVARLCAEEGKRLLFLGGSGKDPEKVGELFKSMYPALDVVACDPGIVDDEIPRLSEATVARIKELNPTVIAVALGQGRGRLQGKQEKVMESLKRELPSVRVLMGIGGAVHTLANPYLQAPAFMKRYGLEWLFRVSHQPWRIKRIFRAIVLFPLEVIWATIRARRFVRGTLNVFKQFKRHGKNV
jgi:N-acetylglucosaminyldiphosphoundecaprenol N-acetyl-beta-D-mannosaminyltransferase